jgi:hypothetical protein
MLEDLTRAREQARVLHREGERWLVYELTSAYDRRGTSLVFESENVVRRVRDYPKNWRDLPDHDLVPLMDRT